MTDVAQPDREADLFAAGCIIAQLFSKDREASLFSS